MQKIILSLVITLLFILVSYFEKKIKNKNEYYNREIIISGVIVLCSSLIVLYLASYFGVKQNINSIQQIYTGSPNF